MIKKIAVLIILFVFIFAPGLKSDSQSTVAPEELSKEGVIEKQLERLNLEDLEKEVKKINQAGKDIYPELSVGKLIDDFLAGELDFNWKKILLLIIHNLGREVAIHLNLMGRIIILCIFSAILKILSDSFSSNRIARTANMIIFLIMGSLLLNSFYQAAELALKTVDSMVNFMQALIPVLLSLLVGMGAVTSASIFHPLTYLIITFLSTVIKNVVFPLVLISFILLIVDNIADDFNISRLASLFKEISISFLTISLSLFVGSSLLQGGVAAVSDSLTLRTAKHLSGKFIPVIGGVFSGALELIVSCSLLIKNTLNLMGILAIIFLITLPLIKIMAMALIYRVTAAFIEPISSKKMVNIINAAGNNLMIISGIVIGVAFMFFLVISIIAGTANFTVMMR
ncbi:MAG: stage III sporulation protein AE [Bacillota bacterium]